MAEDRLKPLDGLRAFAIITVMLFHTDNYFQHVDLSILGAKFQNLIYNGFCGVDLFFVLSGFLITSQILKSPLTKDNTKKFFIKRFLRIAPAYYVILIFVTLFIRVQSDVSEATLPTHDIFTKWFPPFFSHLLFLQDYFFRFPPIMTVFWTLAIEIKFYFLCPVFVYFLNKFQDENTKVLAISGVFIGYILLRYFIFAHYLSTNTMDMNEYLWNVRSTFHTTLDGLMIGGLCAYVNKNQVAQTFLKKKYVANVLVSLGLVLFIILMLPVKYYAIDRNVTLFEIAILPVCVALVFGMIVLGAVNKSHAESFLSHESLKFIATISYCLYLVHILVLKYLQPVGKSNLFQNWNINAIWFCMTILYFCIAIMISYILHRIVEKPCIDWSKKHFSSKALG